MAGGDDDDRARSRSPRRDGGEDEGEHTHPILTEVEGWVSMCPLGQVCGKMQKRLGWYEAKDQAIERVVEHLMDSNCDHGRTIEHDEALGLAQDETCYYEEKKYFDEQGNPVHWPPQRRGGRGYGKGSKGAKGNKGQGKGGKGWQPAPEPAGMPPARAARPAAAFPAVVPTAAAAVGGAGPAPVQRMTSPNSHILAALTGSVPDSPLHVGTLVEAPCSCTQLFLFNVFVAAHSCFFYVSVFTL